MDKKTLTKHLEKCYGIGATSLTLLPDGADINASLYKVDTANHTPYFIKIKKGPSNNLGLAIIERLHRSGIGSVIPPIKSIEGKTTQSIENCTLTVYPFIEGKNGFIQNLTPKQWFDLGKALRQLHELKLPKSLEEKIQVESYSSKWEEAVRATYPLLEADPIGDEVSINLHKFMNGQHSKIIQLVERSEKLGAILRHSPPKRVLCHSDIHAGNVLIDAYFNIYIVDWDAPILAPKERDLMFIGGGVGNAWNDPIEEPLFYKGYGRVDINATALTYYRCVRILEDIAIYCEEILLKPTKITAKLEMYNHFVAMFEPQGVVDLAFQTQS